MHACTACHAGERAKIVHNLSYAAPETILAAEAANRSVVVDAAVDVWALGVIALELVAGELMFPELAAISGLVDAVDADAEQSGLAACNSISGREKLPWEGAGAEVRRKTDQLRSLKRTVRFPSFFALQPI